MPYKDKEKRRECARRWARKNKDKPEMVSVLCNKCHNIQHKKFFNGRLPKFQF